MGKSKETKTEQKIDPAVARNSAANMGLARMLAGLGFTPYGGMDVADVTPMQRQALNAPNLAAGAFGMPTADVMLPTGATEGPQGIMGFNTQDMMEMNSPNYERVMEFINNFSTQAGKKPSKSSRDSRTQPQPTGNARYAFDWRDSR